MTFNLKHNQNEKPSADLDGSYSLVGSTTTIMITIDDWNDNEREVANKITSIVHDYMLSKYPDRAWLMRKYLDFISKFRAKKRPKPIRFLL